MSARRSSMRRGSTVPGPTGSACQYIHSQPSSAPGSQLAVTTARPPRCSSPALTCVVTVSAYLYLLDSLNELPDQVQQHNGGQATARDPLVQLGQVPTFAKTRRNRGKPLSSCWVEIMLPGIDRFTPELDGPCAVCRGTRRRKVEQQDRLLFVVRGFSVASAVSNERAACSCSAGELREACEAQQPRVVVEVER